MPYNVRGKLCSDEVHKIGISEVNEKRICKKKKKHEYIILAVRFRRFNIASKQSVFLCLANQGRIQKFQKGGGGGGRKPNSRKGGPEFDFSEPLSVIFL